MPCQPCTTSRESISPRGGQAEALPLFEEVYRLMKAKLGPDHPNTLVAMYTLAQTCRDIGRLDRALPLLEEVYGLMKAKLGPDHPYSSNAVLMLALTCCDTRRLDRALPLLEEILTRRKTKLGREHIETLVAESHLVRAYLDVRRWADAEVAARECLEILSRTQPDGWLRLPDHEPARRRTGRAGEVRRRRASPDRRLRGAEGTQGRDSGAIPQDTGRRRGADRDVLRDLGQGGSGGGLEGEARLGRPARRSLRPALSGASANTELERSHRPMDAYRGFVWAARAMWRSPGPSGRTGPGCCARTLPPPVPKGVGCKELLHPPGRWGRVI